MNRLALVFLSLFIFVGCREITFQGNLTVQEKFNVKNADGNYVTLTPQTFPLKLTVSKRKTILELSKNLKIELLMPKDAQFPENGSLTLKSAATGQPFDVMAEVTTTHQDSQPVRDTESCQYQRTDTICTPHGCYNQPITVWGQRRVVYKKRQTVRNLTADIFAKNSNLTLATSESSHLENQRVYLEQGPCF